MVAVGTAMSAFWILSANSWMQTPAGFKMKTASPIRRTGSPSSSIRTSPTGFAHMLNASLLNSGFVVHRGRRALSARRQSCREARTMLAWRSSLTAVLAPLQLIIGDQHGLNTLQLSADQGRGHGSTLGRQPARRLRNFGLAGREDRKQPLFDLDPARLFAALYHSWDGLFPGLKDVPPQTVRVTNVFFGFRIMLAMVRS